jgi:hypothetical protein
MEISPTIFVIFGGAGDWKAANKLLARDGHAWGSIA